MKASNFLREMALKHSRKNGSTIFGVNSKLKFDCEWAAWSNGTAVGNLTFMILLYRL